MLFTNQSIAFLLTITSSRALSFTLPSHLHSSVTHLTSPLGYFSSIATRQNSILASVGNSNLSGKVFRRRSNLTQFRQRDNCYGNKFVQRNMQLASFSDEGSSQVEGRAALLQFEVNPSKSTNHVTAEKFISKAVSKGAQLVVLPEIWNGPYATAAFPEYAEILPDVGFSYNENDAITTKKLEEECPSAKLLFDLAKKQSIYIVGGSISEKVIGSTEGDKIYNTCLCIDPNGELVGKHRKVHLFDIDVPGKITFKESDTLSPGESVTSFEAGCFGKVGVGICYDIRFPEYALLLSEKHNCNILIYPGAFNLTTGPAHWELLQKGRAVDNQCYVLTASPARVEVNPDDETLKYPHYTAWGHSTAVTPWGDIAATCDEGEACVIIDIDIEKVKEMRTSIPIMEQKRNDLYKVTSI